jgi:hypothetical protein
MIIAARPLTATDQIVATKTQWNRDCDSEKRARRRQFDALDSKVVFVEPRIMFCVPDISVS